MVNIAANMTQVLTNSPQVTALVAGEAGAVEQIKRREQLEEARRLREEQRSRILAAEKAMRPGDTEEEIRRRLEGRGQIIINGRERRKPPARHPAAAASPSEPAASAATPASLFETQAVVDRCV